MNPMGQERAAGSAEEALGLRRGRASSAMSTRAGRKPWSAPTSLLWLLVCVLVASLGFGTVHCQDADTFVVATVAVENNTVDALTSLTYQLTIRRGSPQIRVEERDYLLLDVPTTSSTARWEPIRAPACAMFNGGKVKKCEILSERRAKVTLAAQENLVLHGSVPNFVNPHSLRGVVGFEVRLYSRTNQLKAYANSLGLNTMEPSSMDVTLSSSSRKVGARDQTLTIRIDPWARLTASGYVLLTMPDYYQGATNDYMIESRGPECGCSRGRVLSCTFSTRQKQLTIHYEFDDGQDHFDAVDFTVGEFNNPVVERMEGFKAELLDAESEMMAETDRRVAMQGITEATSFSEVYFNYVDSPHSGQLAVHQFVVQSSIPVQYGCRIRIVYPEGMRVGGELGLLTGSGFFEPAGDALDFTADYAKNSIDLVACRRNYGQATAGILRLERIRNQLYKHDLESFEIYMTVERDVEFKDVYQKVTSGFEVKASQQKAGRMRGKLEASSTLVQTFASFSIELQPSMDLGERSHLIMDVPKTLDFQGPSCTVAAHRGFSDRISCSRDGHLLNISNPFDKPLKAKTADTLFLKLEEFLMPTSVQKLGNIKLTFMDYRVGQYREVDVIEFEDVATRPGEIQKESEVEVSSDVTSEANQTYTFHFTLFHRVPVGGYFSILLSADDKNGVGITSPELVEENCFRIAGDEEQGLDCVTGTTEDGNRPYVNISCTEGVFGSGGVAKKETLKLRIGGLTNPRARNYKSEFYLSTMDEQLRYIDQNLEDQQFSVTMKRLIKMENVTVRMADETNGAVTTYTIRVVPSTQIHAGDLFKIEFPEELTLSADQVCGIGGTNSPLREISCQRVGARGVHFFLDDIDERHTAGVALEVTVSDVTNAYSLRPSSTFRNILFTDNANKDLSEYSKKVSVATTKVGKIASATTGIRQSSYVASADSIVELYFKTNNPLPATAAIVVDVPPTLAKLHTNTTHCDIKLNGVLVPLGPEKCTATESQVIITEAFAQFVTNDFAGAVQVYFETQNPKDGQDINSTSYNFTLYDSSDTSSTGYRIDELEGGLFPLIGCEYPCKTCRPSDRAFCTSCLPPSTTDRQFLHTPKGSRIQTCVTHCPSEDGYTSNGSQNPQICTKCADTCATCAQNDKPGDIHVCVTCKSEFPYLWKNMSTCHAGGCPEGSYSSETEQCSTCQAPCKACSDEFTCTKCEAKAAEKYLFGTECRSECEKGYTPIDNICVECKAPCATCAFGQVESCLSCDHSTPNPFLYGKACLASCPVNTTELDESKECKGCLVGCAKCDDEDNTICLQCSAGLALFNHVCLEDCPPEFTKNANGSLCEKRTYPLDEAFVLCPFLGTAAFFGLLTLASWWLTGRRSLVASSLIAFFGPIEMAATFYQFMHAAQEGEEFRPVLVGSLSVFSVGVVVNVVFLVNFHKQVKGTDRQFDRWRKQKWIASNLYLALSCVLSVTMYRLIFCRLFRLDAMDVRLNRPQPFLRPILIFSWIKFLVFNLPLIIVDFVGTNAIDDGNQCFMTMVESCVLSFITLALMVWETMKRADLIKREAAHLRLDKVEMMEEEARKEAFGGGGLGQIIPAGPSTALEKEKELLNRAAVSLNKIKFQLQNHVTMAELKDAGTRQPATPRTLKKRVEQLHGVLKQVRRLRDLQLNDELDQLLQLEAEEGKKALRRCKSMEGFKSKQHQAMADGLSERSRADTIPGLDLQEEERLKEFQAYLAELRLREADKNNKAEQWEEPEDMNIYASAREPPPEVITAEGEAQTDQEKAAGALEEESVQRMREQVRDSVTAALLQKRVDVQEATKSRRKKQQRRGKRSHYENAINEEDEADSEKSDEVAQGQVPLSYERPQADMLTLAMQVEKNQSLTSFYDLHQTDIDRMQQDLTAQFSEPQGLGHPPPAGKHMELQPQWPPQDAKGIELSRVSGDLDFSDDEEFNIQYLARDPEAKRLHEKVKIDNVQAWIKDASDSVNQRTFNENDITGNFEREWSGHIREREYTLRKLYFHDKDGNAVNQRGYLIDETTGDIRSQYTFDVLFKHYNLVGIGNSRYELPLPYRLERHNFNPHQCFGNFDYDSEDRPVILQDANGNRLDKNWRPVNASGWLIDEHDNIIDNLGQVKLIAAQLLEDGQLPGLFNYDGREYDIQSIMGVFEKDNHSKEIKLCPVEDKSHVRKKDNAKKFMSCDLRGRKVNAAGYLLDARGNIIDRSGSIIWRGHEILYNEPPKIFPFTEFSINWIMGTLDKDVTQNPRHDDEYDLEGQKINSMGYLIDSQGNVIDRWSKSILFQKDILQDRFGQEAEIPYIFRSGKLRRPDDEIEKHLRKKLDRAMRKGRAGLMGPVEGDSEDDDDMLSDLQKIEKRQKERYGRTQDGALAPMVDATGKEIDAIAPDQEQRALMSDLMMDHEEVFHEEPEEDDLYEGEGEDLLAHDQLAKGKRSKTGSGNGRLGPDLLKEQRASTSQLQSHFSSKQGGLGLRQPDHRSRSALRGSQGPGASRPPAVQLKRNQFMAPSGRGDSLEDEDPVEGRAALRRGQAGSSQTAILDAAQDFPSEDDA